MFKEIVELCEADHKKRYKVNILVIAKEKKTKAEIDQFKGEYKLMPCEVECYWADYNHPNETGHVYFWTKNIYSSSIIKFVPMNLSLPTKLQ